MTEQLILKGTLEGHSGWVTSLATSIEKYAPRTMNEPWLSMQLTCVVAQTCFYQEAVIRLSSSGI